MECNAPAAAVMIGYVVFTARLEGAVVRDGTTFQTNGPTGATATAAVVICAGIAAVDGDLGSGRYRD